MLAAATFTCFIGITIVLPLVPLYVLSLDVGSLGDAALWSGIIVGITPLVSASASPLWGLVADRYGYKPVIQRSLFGFAALFTPQAMGMASTLVPRQRVTWAIGLIQLAQISGSSIGPLLGGVVADRWGFGAAFITAGALNAVTGIAATFWLSGRRQGAGSRVKGRQSVRTLLAFAGFVPILLTLAMLRMAERGIEPLLPLIVVKLGPGGGSSASTAGVIISLGTLAITLSTIIVGRVGDRFKGARLLKVQLVASALACLPFLLASSIWQLAGFRVVLGLATGGTLTLALAFAAKSVPMGTRGTAFGILGSASLYGGAFGMIGSGAIASPDTEWAVSCCGHRNHGKRTANQRGKSRDSARLGLAPVACTGNLD